MIELLPAEVIVRRDIRECNMHARRYFMKALDAGDQRAALPLAAYKRLGRTLTQAVQQVMRTSCRNRNHPRPPRKRRQAGSSRA
jgi:hypothetical protein